MLYLVKLVDGELKEVSADSVEVSKLGALIFRQAEKVVSSFSRGSWAYYRKLSD
jgi:hypothetical protein